MKRFGKRDARRAFVLRPSAGASDSEIEIRANEKLIVGRSDECDVILDHPEVSRRHASLEAQDGHILVTDLGSKNGTFVAGRKVVSAPVLPRDWVIFGTIGYQLAEEVEGCPNLAITIGGGGGRQGVFNPLADSSTQADSRPRPRDRSWVDHLEDLVSPLLAPTEPDLGEYLAALRQVLGSVTVHLVEVTDDGEIVQLASAGSVELDRLQVRISRILSSHPTPEHGEVTIQSVTDGGFPATAWALAHGTGHPRIALGVIGRAGQADDVPALLKVLLRLVLHAYPRVQHLPAGVRAEKARLVFPAGYERGASPVMEQLYLQIEQIVRAEIPVLIEGETGVGKEHIAEILHLSSSRATGPFVAVNCAAIPADLLEAELFGIKRGIATGVDARTGKFQLAEGGILFLDEIAEMPPTLQPKLLRALQQMEIHPVGSTRAVPVNVRVISATNADVVSRLNDGSFRRDLFYRLAGVRLRVPALRDRREDIPRLVERFLRQCADEINKPIRGVTVRALEKLQNASWPGNVRELQHEVRRLAYVCRPGQAIDADLLSLNDADLTVGSGETSSTSLSLRDNVESLERRLIELAMTWAGGNRSLAAKLLGISRNGLAMKMSRLGQPSTSNET